MYPLCVAGFGYNMAKELMVSNPCIQIEAITCYLANKKLWMLQWINNISAAKLIVSGVQYQSTRWQILIMPNINQLGNYCRMEAGISRVQTIKLFYWNRFLIQNIYSASTTNQMGTYLVSKWQLRNLWC